jgi:hypothetical protein
MAMVVAVSGTTVGVSDRTRVGVAVGSSEVAATVGSSVAAAVAGVGVSPPTTTSSPAVKILKMSTPTRQIRTSITSPIRITRRFSLIAPMDLLRQQLTANFEEMRDYQTLISSGKDKVVDAK